MQPRPCIVLLMLALATRAAAQAPLPPLPRPFLESYPSSTREAVAPVLGEATARPTDPAAVGALGRVLHAWEQYEAAHQAYTRAQALAPRSFEWQYLDGLVLARLARHREAADRLEKALALKSDYLPARLKLADALFDAGDLVRSRSLLEALATDPLAEPGARFGLGRIDAAQNRLDAAVQNFERAVALVPEWGPAHYALARSYRAMGRLAEAERALQRHGLYGPQSPGVDDPLLASVTALRDDGRTNLQRGLRLAASGDLEGAIAAHDTALLRDPSLGQAHANLIGLYGRTRAWAKAEEHYRAAVALGFGLADVHYDYGVLLGLQEKWDLAEQAYRDAVAVNPQHARAHNNLGQILERKREIEEARAQYREAVDALPTFRLARFNLGRVLLGLGRVEQALAEFDKLQEPRDSETPRYLFALATAHVRAGHKATGITWAMEAKRLALEDGQQDLAAAIERDLASLR